jgi:hypothetical protein
MVGTVHRAQELATAKYPFLRDVYTSYLHVKMKIMIYIQTT